MKTMIVALIALAAAGAGGLYGWQQKRELDRNASEFAATRAALAKATAELRSARELLAKATSELQEQQASAEKMRSERDEAVGFLQQEKAHGERLRAELTLAQQQLAFVRTRQSQFAPPSVVQPQQPMIIRAIPAPRPQSAASPASPIQGQSPQGFGSAGRPAQ
jgi:uncharacterized protein HemX